MTLKIVENFDGTFTLNADAREILFHLLKSENFLNQIFQYVSCSSIEFTERLFQPVPYSRETPKGMPREFEQYHESDDYLIINVPPNFMFDAKIFNPNCLCAIYRKTE
ncbi:MAG: hypothetical protein J7641_01290 [Cyanobacteria bacterium SID2]|nr:hypothetical protein [Cyanobacteria bacterium SID2]